MTDSPRKVGVKGMGLVCCLGNGADAVFRRMCREECGIKPISRFPVEGYAQIRGGQLPDEVENSLRTKFPKDDIAGAMIKTAAGEALRQADYSTDAQQPDPRLGLILATNFGPMESLEWCWREKIDTGKMDPGTFRTFDDFLDDMAQHLGCGGPRVQLSLSCASGSSAVALGNDWIREKRADRVLAVGYDALTEYCWSGLSNLRTITPDIIRPFDSKRSGTIFSEGAGALILEPANSPELRNDRWLAEILGSAVNNNAFHMTAPAKDADGSRRVMVTAIKQAGISPSDIEHISAHGTGTTANDKTEVAAFRNLFGDRIAEISVTAHKSQLGHMMGAAGITEIIMTIQALRQEKIPGILNCSQIDPECLGPDFVLESVRSKQFRTAITNSAGLGGNNSAIVLTRASHQRR